MAISMVAKQTFSSECKYGNWGTLLKSSSGYIWINKLIQKHIGFISKCLFILFHSSSFRAKICWNVFCYHGKGNCCTHTHTHTQAQHISRWSISYHSPNATSHRIPFECLMLEIKTRKFRMKCEIMNFINSTNNNNCSRKKRNAYHFRVYAVFLFRSLLSNS